MTGEAGLNAEETAAQDALSVSTLSHAIDRFAGCRVLCIGDVMLDKFVYGQIERISPEAPIPVFSIKEEFSMLGGAGNVARNLVALGAKTSFISVTGNDKIAHVITSMIGKEPLITPYILSEQDRISTTKTRFVAGTQQVLRADHEIARPVQDHTATQIIATAQEEIKHHDVVLLSDYGKGLFTRPIVQTIISAAKVLNKPVIVDPKSRDFSLYSGATCVSPNLHELANAAARELKHEDEIIESAQLLMKKHQLENILVTRSREGMTLIQASGGTHHIPARAQEVFDVSGAGDTAIATLTLGIAAGYSYHQAAMLANLAAGIVVGRLGTSVVTAQDLKTALMSHERATGLHKILPLSAALIQIQQWKREGRTIGFTNGCFDLVHAGHLALLHEAKFHSDKLVVAINSDASVKRLKGAARPINSEVERALLLSSLTNIDLVVVFEEDTPIKLIEAIKPGVLVKGSDYRKDQVVGADIIEKSGGKIVLVPLKEGYSTTNIIKKMA